MPKVQDLVGWRFGKLTVLERLPEREERYHTWRCRCDCGGEVTVNTKRLKRGTITNCGCIPKNRALNGQIAEDLTGRRFGRLLPLHRAENISGRTKWICQCDCGNTCTVSSHELKAGKTKSCGCYKIQSLQHRKSDIQGQKFGRLTALFATDQRDRKGSVFWHCRCDCGNEADITEDGLVHGNYVSCGCRKQEVQESIQEQLTFVDGTCVEWLNSRKERSDNTSGFRGVNQTSSGKWKAMIGLQSRRYYLGTFDILGEAISARLEAEEILHNGFVRAYEHYAELAEQDPEWAKTHPFYFRVERIHGEFYIHTTDMTMKDPAAT